MNTPNYTDTMSTTRREAGWSRWILPLSLLGALLMQPVFGWWAIVFGFSFFLLATGATEALALVRLKLSHRTAMDAQAEAVSSG